MTKSLNLRIWRQEGPDDSGRFVEYSVEEITDETSFLEMLDALNEKLIASGEEPVAFDSDCREGVCGTCSLVIDGQPHGPLGRTATCQLYMRHFEDGDVITIEPFRAAAFPLVRDLVVDRGAFDRIIQAGGYISVHSGPKPDPNSIPIEPDIAEQALDAASCIGCGACVAACPNASAMLFTSAKVSHLGLLPQGQPERWERVERMVAQMEEEGFGSCRNYAECEAQCPKGISIDFIGRMNRDYTRAVLREPIDRRGKMVPQ
ncbi:MAG: succinate dehydrogenase/fumarate reductase iron-sulfur subunit [Gemmatimonadota bacterium]|nr:succinate dehydrogenase/fumarate reductase iron-sulfur subunit [Gemmatimonadota bacterium]